MPYTEYPDEVSPQKNHEATTYAARLEDANYLWLDPTGKLKEASQAVTKRELGEFERFYLLKSKG